MKLVSFRVHTEDRVGALIGERVIDLNSAYSSLLSEEREPEQARRAADAAVPPEWTPSLADAPVSGSPDPEPPR